MNQPYMNYKNISIDPSLDYNKLSISNLNKVDNLFDHRPELIQQGGESVSISNKINEIEIPLNHPDPLDPLDPLESEGLTEQHPITTDLAEDMIGGNFTEESPEGEIFQSDDMLIEETGNFVNPAEDFISVDDLGQDGVEYNEESDIGTSELLDTSEQGKFLYDLSSWKHPELEMDDDLVSELDHDQILSRASKYVDRYFSKEFYEYKDYLKAFYSKIGNKYYLQYDSNENVYLVETPKFKPGSDEKRIWQKEKLGKIKTPSEYIAKITPPRYIHLNEALDKINSKLRKVNMDVLQLRGQLMSKGADITKDEISNFKRLKAKYNKYYNRREIYSKYYLLVNNLEEEQRSIPYFAKEMKTRLDKANNQVFYLVNNVVELTPEMKEKMHQQIITNLNNYTDVLENLEQTDSRVKVETFIKKKQKMEEDIEKEIGSLISKKKGLIDFLIDRMPSVNIRKDIFKLKPMSSES